MDFLKAGRHSRRLIQTTDQKTLITVSENYTLGICLTGHLSTSFSGLS